MDVRTIQKMEERIREIEDWLHILESPEMAPGWLHAGADPYEIERLHKEKEHLLEELAKAA